MKTERPGGKDPYAAALLSLFFPGAGQWYLGQPHKGMGLLLCAALAWFAVPVAAWALNVLASLDAYQLGVRVEHGAGLQTWDWFWNRTPEG